MLALASVVVLAALGFLVVKLQGSAAENAPVSKRTPVPAIVAAASPVGGAPPPGGEALGRPAAAAGETGGGGVTIAGSGTVTPTLAATRPTEGAVAASVMHPAVRQAPAPTLIPTMTPIPSTTLAPMPTTAPTRTPAPTAASIPPTAPRPISSSSGGVTLVAPAANAALQGRVTFEWRASGFSLGTGKQYELVFWLPGQDGLSDGRSPVGASAQPNATVDMAGVSGQLGLPSGSSVWGVRLWGASGAVRMLSEGRPFTVAQGDGGGGGGSPGTVCERPPCK